VTAARYGGAMTLMALLLALGWTAMRPRSEAIAPTARLTGLTPTQARISLDYYADNRDEIDAWIERASTAG
jgi:hypothetical protein